MTDLQHTQSTEFFDDAVALQHKILDFINEAKVTQAVAVLSLGMALSTACATTDMDPELVLKAFVNLLEQAYAQAATLPTSTTAH